MLKTRNKLIDIARQLFAHKGIENTTMNDIAIAAKKGRRTIYTYFKNKRDIYNAVIESESGIVLKRLSEIVDLPLPADQKLMEFIFQRFDAMKDLVYRNGSLRADFFRDVRKVERARKTTSPKEIKMLESILREGVESGIFRIKHTDKMAMVMLLCLQGLDVPYIRDNFKEIGIEKDKLREYLYDFILYGIKQ
ncbi:MAG TPA: TetR/AcrR family transcriptional regulator [Candidatus Limisoma intestinavium]|uniref:TetR/AcrR family transcriptional regulator n=1 Tax=Candidatus Limisoma intestinavium TaxID=2840856 RepID=A0A9D1IL12_9BACT|nr:TetR/AcrR family transcriptional regulator [Candidatus Limisoma intestinavium]